jgi:hypothetical protein
MLYIEMETDRTVLEEELEILKGAIKALAKRDQSYDLEFIRENKDEFINRISELKEQLNSLPTTNTALQNKSHQGDNNKFVDNLQLLINDLNSKCDCKFLAAYTQNDDRWLLYCDDYYSYKDTEHLRNELRQKYDVKIACVCVAKVTVNIMEQKHASDKKFILLK